MPAVRRMSSTTAPWPPAPMISTSGGVDAGIFLLSDDPPPSGESKQLAKSSFLPGGAHGFHEGFGVRGDRGPVFFGDRVFGDKRGTRADAYSPRSNPFA